MRVVDSLRVNRQVSTASDVLTVASGVLRVDGVDECLKSQLRVIYLRFVIFRSGKVSSVVGDRPVLSHATTRSTAACTRR